MSFPLMRNNIIREDLDLVIDYLKQDDPKLTQGDKVRDFEKKWSNWLGVKYSVFVNSGSSENLLSLMALKNEFPDGGEVIVPSLTWVSDITSVINFGFKPIFVDVTMNTLSLDTEKVLSKISSSTKAIFITHAQGFNGLTDKLLDVLEKNNIKLIEDVCESHGACHNNRKLGSYGWLSNFSFYYAHHMSTIEGGMICTNDYKVYQLLKICRGHGMLRECDDKELKEFYFSKYPDLNPDFIFTHFGYNLRNNEIGAIIGINQLNRLDKNIKLRNLNLKIFLDNIDDTKFITEFDLVGCSNYAFNLILRHKNDGLLKRVMRSLTDNKVEFRRGSAGGGNQLRQPYIQPYVPKEHYKNFLNTEHIHFYGFYIGNFPDLQKNEIMNICNIINDA